MLKNYFQKKFWQRCWNA